MAEPEVFVSVSRLWPRFAALSILAASSLLAATAQPAPPCVPGTLASYLALPGEGCTISDDVSVMDFDFEVIDVNGVPLTPDEIDVTPVFGRINRYGLLLSSDRFSVTGDEFARYRIDYVFDPTDIRSLEDVMGTLTPVAPGTATVDTFVCKGAPFGPECTTETLQITVFHRGTEFDLQDSTLIDPPQRIVGVRHVIDLQANGASADFRSLENAVFVVPEPATWMLMLGGSALLALRARRRRR
jgi:hypothetical protein